MVPDSPKIARFLNRFSGREEGSAKWIKNGRLGQSSMHLGLDHLYEFILMPTEPLKIRYTGRARNPFYHRVRIGQDMGINLFESDNIFSAAIKQDLCILVNG